MTPGLSVLIVARDAYLAAAFGRRFVRDGWDAETVHTVKDAEHLAVRMRPTVLFLHTALTPDPAAEVRRLRALPTLRKTVIVLLADDAHMHGVTAARAAGAADYVVLGHVVPAELVARVKRLVEV